MVMIRDGHVTLGVGRTLDEAVQHACIVNKMIRLEPSNMADMKAMIDNGTLKVREYRA